ncbi:hypothetical protein [Actinomyces ruminicola]|uniref:SAF domain-containing protein n=1 Tax=Actinomyces ruminicola TaxID=332524 RepID=A0A1G9YDC7_9ACTO|nr:hypothetical protein [Actinomyces ruminicola]SDN06987.1 hypothetical protein SAMN04487766_11231 [Actinomyces ruminicola]
MSSAQRSAPDSAAPARTPRTRLRRPTWKDPRLAGGLALIGAAVALGAWAVNAAADTEQIYVLSHDVAPGTDLTAAGVLSLVDSHPGTAVYVAAGELPDDAVATRSLQAGELLPSGAVGRAADVALRSVVLDVASGLPADTSAGDIVDLWVLPATQATVQDSGSAEVVARGLLIASVGEAGTSLVDGTSVQVEVLVPEETVADVLTAVGGGGPLVLVPTGQGQ